MEGSRERLLYTERNRNYETYDTRRYRPQRYETTRHDSRNSRQDERYKPRRKNGYVYEDIYSDFDEAQGRLSLFRPIRPEYLNLPSSIETKYNSLPRNYQHYEDRNNRRYKKDYYDFRIETERRRPRTERNSYEPYKRQPELRRNSNAEAEAYKRTRPEAKNVAVCKPIRVPEKPAKYWTTEPPKSAQKQKRLDSEPKKNVKFSEVSGFNRKTIVDDPIVGRKVVPVRELEVSLDQMIQNGYFDKLNIPITKPNVPDKQDIVKEENFNVYGNMANGKGNAPMPNGKCVTERTVEATVMSRRPRHLPQVSERFFFRLTLLSIG